jgi:hypothetical protein
LNPYSYILNNPLSGTDPTGYVPTCRDDPSLCGRGVVGGTSFDCQRGANCSSLLVYVDNGIETNAGQILLVGDVSQLEGRQSIGVEEINIVEDRHGDITITIALGGTEAKAPIVTFTSRRGKQQILPGIPSDVSQLKTPSRYAGYFKYDLEQDYPDLGTGNSVSATEFFSTIVAAVLCQCNPNASPDPAFPDAIQSVGSPIELFSGSATSAGAYLIGRTVRYGPTNSGPLSNSVAATFRGGSYTVTRASETLTLYRVYGGKAGKIGGYWTRVRPGGPLQSQLDLALVPEWGNTARNIISIRVPRGTTIYEGYAAPQPTGVGQILGGGNQVYIPYVKPKWVQ